MTRAITFSAVALSFVLAALQDARPDLSGHWLLDAAATAAANGGGGAGVVVPAEVDEGGARAICGRAFVLTQTADRLFIERQLGERSLAAAFRLDGTQTKHPVLGCRILSKGMAREATYVEAPTDMTATASWGTSSLMLRTAVVGSSSEARQVLALQSDKTLLVETTFVRPGERFRPVRAVYRKR